MLFTIMQVLYVVVAILMIVFILLQRGAGAQAGSSFGAGASGTVFGASGSANFLSRSTAALCGLFFALSLGMAGYISHNGRKPAAQQDMGIMGSVTEVPAVGAVAADPTAAPAPIPAALVAPQDPTSDIPAAPVAVEKAPAADDAPAPVKEDGQDN